MTSTDTEPDRIIADAEQEAAEAEKLVTTLEEKVKSGDPDVTFEEVDRARGVLSFVRLRKEAARRKAVAAKEAARLQACEALNAEITALAAGDGQRFSDQLKAAVDALRAFHDAVEERNAKIREFRQRAEALGVGEHKHTGPVPATHGGVRLTTGGSTGLSAGVVVGRTRVEGIDPDLFANRALDLLVREGKLKIQSNVDAGEDLFADLAAIDAEAPESSAKHFYRGPNGGVIRKDDAFSQDEIQRMNLTVITKAEAAAE